MLKLVFTESGNWVSFVNVTICDLEVIMHVCRQLWAFVHDTSYDDSKQRQEFLQRVSTVFSQLFALLSHDAMLPSSTHPSAASVCKAARASVGIILSSERMLHWFERVLGHELQSQTASFNEQVEQHAQRGAGWALQREHAMPIVQCRRTLPTIVKALREDQMSGNHINNYDIVLQWVGAHWNSLFMYPQELLFDGQQGILSVTPSHLQNLEARLLSIETISKKLRQPLVDLVSLPSSADVTAEVQQLQQQEDASNAHRALLLQQQVDLEQQAEAAQRLARQLAHSTSNLRSTLDEQNMQVLSHCALNHILHAGFVSVI